MSRVQDFAEMSAALTGFSVSVLAPQLDPVNLKQQYLDVLDAFDKEQGTHYTDELIAEFLLLKKAGKSDQEIADALLEVQAETPSERAKVAQSAARLWLLGSWYPPFEPPSQQMFNNRVISAHGYIQGLAWKAMQSKAMGSSELAFGSWTEPPASLDDFLTGN